MKCLLAISAFLALVSANTEKIIFHTTESPLSTNDPTTVTHIDAWAERNGWPILRAPFTTLADSIRPQSSLDEGPNPINPENPHYEFQSEIPFQRWYRVRGLIEGGGYEARISYPATSPTDFSLELLNHTQLYNILSDPLKYGSSNADGFKDFIDTDTETNNNPDDLDSEIWMFLLVEGNYTGISIVEGVEFRPVKYNIALEQLHMGFIPNQAYKLAISLLLVIGLGSFVVAPKFYAHIEDAANDHTAQVHKKRS
ncbi:hypothetical protein K450DRAFT_243069 [Umbelopsis ramanniana AG]|uniref:Uncharacterized protein n=1 Tax=Umbelopsis ramanniana AG TaxID=1314678 RepID=A0AAD5E823_UMBRA|nr:uncharacterized protein K450DRAFT_243069 [Umbelopsis ramanniana AG]KAI8579163.1 hypothetical protein K450DRAFT_243069 [Umbelopsis ramanniana AG]